MREVHDAVSVTVSVVSEELDAAPVSVSVPCALAELASLLTGFKNPWAKLLRWQHILQPSRFIDL